jgi:transcriptional regulator with XRE-family HTH domain
VAGRDATALGEFIRRQRELNELSMRQVASMAGISNPYLSQIERGLRAPSEQVLEAIAASLQTTAETLRRDAGVPPSSAEEDGEPAVVTAIKDDRRLTPAQRRALLEVYKAFVAQAG